MERAFSDSDRGTTAVSFAFSNPPGGPVGGSRPKIRAIRGSPAALPSRPSARPNPPALSGRR